MLAALGSVQFTGFDLVNNFYPELINTKRHLFHMNKILLILSGYHPIVMGVHPCCLPIPGDPIVGIAQKKKGEVVHAIDCHY